VFGGLGLDFGGAHLQSHLMALFDQTDNFARNVLDAFSGIEAIEVL